MMPTKRRQGRYHGVRGQPDDAARLQRPLGRNALVRRRQPPRRRHARLKRLIDPRVVRDGPVVQASRATVFPGHAAAHVAALVWLVVVGRLVVSAVEHVPVEGEREDQLRWRHAGAAVIIDAVLDEG